jgi:preprotein translocase subunit SecD
MNRHFAVGSVIVLIALANGLLVMAGSSAMQDQATPSSTEAATPDGTTRHPFLNPCTNNPFHTIATGAAFGTAEAAVASYSNNQWVVNFTLSDNKEAKAFSTYTATHIGQPLAIVLDGQILSAPTVQAALTIGGVITGNFTKENAQGLAVQLRYGALPTSLSVESINTIESGLRVVLVADNPKATDEDISATKQIIERRLNNLGIVQPSIIPIADHRLQIDLSGVTDPQAVIETIKQTGLLEFVDFSQTGSCKALMPQAGAYILTDAQIARTQAGPTAEATESN